MVIPPITADELYALYGESQARLVKATVVNAQLEAAVAQRDARIKALEGDVAALTADKDTKDVADKIMAKKPKG